MVADSVRHGLSWANARVYKAASDMSDDAYRKDGGAFFGSVHRPLNHLLVTDRIWMKRFGARDDAPTRLDEILFEDFAELSAARQAEDAAIENWIGMLTQADLSGMIRYRRATENTEIAQPLISALVHMFNHQTHHRGQVHCLMTGIENRDFAPALDLLAYQRETGVGMA